MSHPVALPPVHDTSPPPFDDDVDENDLEPTIEINRFVLSTSPDVLNNSNDDDWKSVNNDDVDDVDTNNDSNTTQTHEDTAIVTEEETTAIEITPANDVNEDWANFAAFENKTDEVLETPPTTASAVVEANNDVNWADFESNTAPISEEPVLSSNDQPSDAIAKQEKEEVEEKQQEEENDDDDDDFGEFNEVSVAPQPQISSLPTETLKSEQIESLLSTCFPSESVTSSRDEELSITPELPSFTTYKDPAKQVSYLEPSLSLWNILSNLTNDPAGIKFQWRKSNTERLFHQALGVNERFRTKNLPLTPEILQPEKLKSSISTNSETENLNNENKLSTENIQPRFDWKQSGLQNPLADNDSSSLSSNISKNEENGFDANKSLDLDFYVPPLKSSNDVEQTSSIPSSNDSPIIPQPSTRTSIPIKTMDLYPGSTTTATTINEDAKRIIDNLPNLSFMNAKALMFPIRFNANTDESNSLF